MLCLDVTAPLLQICELLLLNFHVKIIRRCKHGGMGSVALSGTRAAVPSELPATTPQQQRQTAVECFPSAQVLFVLPWLPVPVAT